MKSFIPNEKNVKALGRTGWNDGTLWMAFSGAGVAFSFTGTKAQITVEGDEISYHKEDVDNQARIAVYVNGSRVVDDMLDEPQKTYEIWNSEKPQTCEVEVIKISESAMSTVGLRSIETDAEDGIHPLPEKEHLMEVIGDSITCGYGVDDEVEEHSFSTRTEDATKAYAYLTAKALDADYRLVSLSGYGLVTGFVDSPIMKKPEQTIQQYYEKLGFCYSTYKGVLPQDANWDFSGRQPELIVINLGTNDDSYTVDDKERQEEYRAAYTAFLKQIRTKNPDARILCVLGIMGDRLYPMVEKAVEIYRKDTGDERISAMPFPVQNPEADGIAADSHPSRQTQKKAAGQLTAKIKEIMGW